MSPARWLPFSRSVTASCCRQRFDLAPYVLIPMPRKPLPGRLLLVSWLAVGSLQPEKTAPFPGDQPFSPSPLLPLAVPHTRYRTTYFDNLRGTWKSRMYWKYKKNRGLAKRASGAG